MSDIDWNKIHQISRERFSKIHRKLLESERYEYEYTLDILCLMALADAFGFEYGEFVGATPTQP